MKDDPLPIHVMRLVAPQAIRSYAQALGWQPVPGVNGNIAVYHRPDSEVYQLIVPLDETYDDYGELVQEALRKLAEFEGRPAREVLDHLLLPPADMLRFRDASPDTETGTMHLEQAINLLEGARRMLLSVAHSVLLPQPYHPRLGRHEAAQFVSSCRMGQTERGSFTVALACSLPLVTDTLFAEEPYGRRVTHGLISSLRSIADAADHNNISVLADREKHPLLSANFCEALLMLRPTGERSSLHVSAAWSKALPLPDSQPKETAIQLRQECFDAAEYIAPKLRFTPVAKQESFVGFVDVLRGQADASGAMCGEVVFSIILDGGESIRARAQLNAKDYQVAGEAHLHNEPVFFRAYLVREPRNNRVDQVTEFRQIQT